MQKIWQEKWLEHEYGEPTDIQTAIYEPLQNGDDVIAISPTGTGKTVAYTLPILEKIEKKPHTQWLVLAPSHELVMQISDTIKTWVPEGIHVLPIIGGANVKRQIEKLKKKPQIIVASPGRALELIKQKKIKMHEVKTITLDEADQLLLAENFKATMEILASSMRDRQLVLVSATKLDDSEQFFRQTEKKPLFIEATPVERANENVSHLYMEVENRDKATLIRRLEHVPNMRALVFVRDKPRMDILLEKLAYDGVKAAGIHGDIRRDVRKKTLQAFKKAELNFLIVTDVAARGLDIPDLPYVIHYDLAKTAKEYVHRSGRTGRMGKTGIVISFVNERETRTLKQYLKGINQTGELVRFYKGKLMPGVAPKKK